MPPFTPRLAGPALAVAFVAAACGGVSGAGVSANPGTDAGADTGSANDENDSGTCSSPNDCAGKCGQLLSACGTLFDCPGCSGGQVCGGGGPNVCGAGLCIPSCAGIGCGESNGCDGVCTAGTCPTGEYCAQGVCAKPSSDAGSGSDAKLSSDSGSGSDAKLTSDAKPSSDSGSGSDAKPPSDGGTSECGAFYTTGIAACDSCLIASCCALETTCAGDLNCENCIGAGNTMGTFNCIQEDPNASALVNCYKANCVAACGS